MGILDETRFVERLQFFNGQRLFAADLQGVEAFNREMRWLHNRSLHQPGIGNGFAVRGDKGERQVWVGPGYALDALGREIVLTQPLTLQVPPVASDDDGKPVLYDLAVRYPDDADLEEAETRAGICDTHGVVRLQEAPIFCWVRLARGAQGNPTVQDSNLKQAIAQGMLITLARMEVLNCQLHGFVSIAERRNARPDCLPYMACGVVDPTEWEVVELLAQSHSLTSRLILTADVDTKEAGFEITPCYTAAILGPRTLFVGDGEDGYEQEMLLIDHVYVQDPRPDGFTAFVVVNADSIAYASPSPSPEVVLTHAAVVEGEETAETDAGEGWRNWFRQNWRLQWLGVEG